MEINTNFDIKLDAEKVKIGNLSLSDILGITESRTFGEKTGETISNREEFIGKRYVRITSHSSAFGLVDLYFPETKTYVKNIATSDKAHMNLWRITREEERGMKKEENHWNATISMTDDRFLDDGPNHCGLRVDLLKCLMK